MVTVSEETAVDYELTARIATEAFAPARVAFSAERIRWLYERGFGGGTTVLAATVDGRKVGQIALLGQSVQIDGEICPAVQLVDLFILQAYRSAQLARRLYKEVERICVERDIRYILALPNDKSALLNARFLKLTPLLSLPIRAGLSLRRPTASKLRYSGLCKSMTGAQALALLSAYGCPATENGLRWDGAGLFDRLDDPTRDYAVHATTDLLLISSSRKTAGLPYAALCAFFARPQGAAGREDVGELVRAACRLWQTPVFVYAGVNGRLPKLPGIALPARLRRPILVQLRDMKRETPDLRLDRFELIDSDFA
jgi:GNAT superfamily N-acetyltransferase